MTSHVPTVQTIYAAFARGDVPAILDRLAPDVDWEHDWGAPPLALYQPRRGRDAVPGFFGLLAALEFRRFDVANLLEGGDQVMGLIHLEVMVKATGRVVRDLEAHLWTFGADGRVARFRHLCDTRQFAAAGLD